MLALGTHPTALLRGSPSQPGLPPTHPPHTGSPQGTKEGIGGSRVSKRSATSQAARPWRLRTETAPALPAERSPHSHGGRTSPPVRTRRLALRLRLLPPPTQQASLRMEPCAAEGAMWLPPTTPPARPFSRRYLVQPTPMPLPPPAAPRMRTRGAPFFALPRFAPLEISRRFPRLSPGLCACAPGRAARQRRAPEAAAGVSRALPPSRGRWLPAPVWGEAREPSPWPLLWRITSTVSFRRAETSRGRPRGGGDGNGPSLPFAPAGMRGGRVRRAQRLGAAPGCGGLVAAARRGVGCQGCCGHRVPPGPARCELRGGAEP